jgi:hypothetical protein
MDAQAEMAMFGTLTDSVNVCKMYHMPGPYGCAAAQ